MKGVKFLNWTNYVISGIAVIILGIFIIIGNANLYERGITILVYAFLLLGISQLLTLLFKDRKDFQKQSLIRSCSNIVFAIGMMIYPNIPLSIIPLLFAFYLLFNFIVKSVSSYIGFRDHLSNRWFDVVLAFFYFVSGVSFLFSPLGHLPTLLSIIGVYLILFGLSEFRELLKEVIPPHFKRKIKRSFRLSLPVFFEAFLPRKMLNDLNQYFNDMKEIKEESFVQEKEMESPDLEIFIHLSPLGFNQFGHMDIFFEGKVLSYGNYDKSSIRFFECIGDGVLFETNKELYIPFVIKHSEKTLIGFGLKLTENQKDLIRNEIKHIKEDAYPWISRAQQDLANHVVKKVDAYDDYASVLYLETKKKTNFYKFSSGTFKTYFVLVTNCTLFADRIVGKSGTDLLKMVGLITPGTYLDYLDHEFHKKKSMVISKTIYNEVTKEKAIHKNKKKSLKKKKNVVE